jgi:phospho-N-acetylmuramoyl-pentapeptide-transferase
MKTILLAAFVAILVSLFGTPVAIRIFRRRGYGQLIREDGPEAHLTKRGTPTMGGTVIVIASVAGYFAGHLLTHDPASPSGLLVLFLMAGLGLVGFIDDFIKIYKQRSLGLRSRAKLAGQIAVSVVFAVLVLHFPDQFDLTPGDARISLLHDIGPTLPLVVFVLWIVLLIAGFSNGVNLTDGLDGLAAGSAMLVLAAYVLIANWQLRNDCTSATPVAAHCYEIASPLDLAVVAAAALGACFGFLWWNAPPAKIFMGDTGSLALGGVLAGLAVTTKTQLLLVVLGGLFVIVTASVIIQVGFFKMTGRRVFRMAPLQHHFELLGWAETTIVIRFWLVSGLCIALALGIFYVEWLPG